MDFKGNLSPQRLLIYGYEQRPIKIELYDKDCEVLIKKLYTESVAGQTGYYNIYFAFVKCNNPDYLYRAKFNPLNGEGEITEKAQVKP